VDLGTTRCKAAVFDEGLEEIAHFSKEIPTAHPEPDWAEQNPADWWSALREGVRSCIAEIDSAEVEALGLCSHRESLVGLDRGGEAIFPSILWADRRCEAEAIELREAFGEEIHQRTGMKPDPYFTAPKILWLRRNRPRQWMRVDKFLLPKDYLVFRLTGLLSTDYTVASRTMMLDIRRQEWWDELLEYVGAGDDRMCSPRRADSVVGEVLPEVRRELGLEGEPVVVAGAGDRQCEALAAGVSPQRAMESTGSATNLSIVTPTLPPKLRQGVLYSNHALVGQYLMEQGIGTTGLALKWFKEAFVPPGSPRAFREDPYGFIDREASRSPAGSGGLIFLPFMSGAQATRWNPRATGVLLGLRLGHRYGDIARAILEGVGFEIRSALSLLKEEGFDPEVVLALGGAARSSIWNQIKADISQRSYFRPRALEAAALGAAMLASLACGRNFKADKVNPIEEEWVPRKEVSSIYDGVYRHYEEVYEANKGVFSESPR